MHDFDSEDISTASSKFSFSFPTDYWTCVCLNPANDKSMVRGLCRSGRTVPFNPSTSHQLIKIEYQI